MDRKYGCCVEILDILKILLLEGCNIGNFSFMWSKVFFFFLVLLVSIKKNFEVFFIYCVKGFGRVCVNGSGFVVY